MKQLVLIAALVLITVSSISWAEERIRLADLPTLATFVEELRDLAEQEDAAAIRERIWPMFTIERDFGGGFMPGFPAWWNFSSVYPIASRVIDPAEPWWKRIEAAPPEYFVAENPEKYMDQWKMEVGVGVSRFDTTSRERGRKEFLNDLPRRTVLKSYVDDEDRNLQYNQYCGEALPLPKDWTAKDGPSMKGLWAYVEATQLNRRKAPSTQSPVIGLHEIEDMVKLVSDLPVVDPKGSYRWVKVESPWPKNFFEPGYVAARHLTFLQNPQICFGRVGPENAWRIVAVVKAGD
ncbi:hypothetical protein [Magnetospira sp. QH-2]|uniref:hypothetical protein n=1 Tax=Magnetospira sp. (strain QH-2) TaxID=1288970 RepID=UPI0003E8109D|nr:hypothetical protein [Magnetospira sp. QH-2]CCQ72197.1 protein of unknown function [Magnetospira sp. QH-2]